jgi:hypothetical protein
MVFSDEEDESDTCIPDGIEAIPGDPRSSLYQMVMA